LKQKKNTQYHYYFKDPRTGQFRRTRINLTDEDINEFRKQDPYYSQHYDYEDNQSGINKFTSFFIGFTFMSSLAIMVAIFVHALITFSRKNKQPYLNNRTLIYPIGNDPILRQYGVYNSNERIKKRIDRRLNDYYYSQELNKKYK